MSSMACRDSSSVASPTLMSLPSIAPPRCPGSCVNCHTANATNPDEFTLHIRGEKGATLIRHQGKDDWMKSKNLEVGGPMVFPCWHPSGKFIAFSTNDTQQYFHSQAKKRIEYFDMSSDIFIYNPRRMRRWWMLALPPRSIWRTALCFRQTVSGSDHITAPFRDPKQHFRESRYSLCRVGF